MSPGNPGVQSAAVSVGGAALGSATGGDGTTSLQTPAGGGGANPALLAAPIGLAGLGTAALGALKAKDAAAVTGGEGEEGPLDD